ncbi:hypothetical protein BCR42DRAFT_149149 [Absidia repens]|uniref:SMAD/FHA domain-containing protein n=1 Tax=Absidia repens TaxID=90262 RepID=A0A1X2I2N5_9FUNG|nr:hypothetical protein BCR42DRAFT_149149 [Absidia repens]
MPTGRSRSQSTSSPNSSRPTQASPLLSRGFASLRRSHRHTTSIEQQRQSTPATDSSSSSRRRNMDTPAVATGDDNNNTAATVGPSSATTSPPVQEHKIRLVPNIGVTTRCFVFDVIERTLHSGVVLKFGRYSDRNSCSERLSFKSKVVSRCHAEIWQENGKIYIKDSGSSSGTFVNRARLSPANTASRAYAIQDGDLIQLGVDYKGGIQPMYRAVRMRFEVDRSPTLQQTAFSRVAFRQLKHCLRSSLGPASSNNNNNKNKNNGLASTPEANDTDDIASLTQETGKKALTSAEPHALTQLSSSSAAGAAASSSTTSLSSLDIQECCICLYSMGPGQALFIAPCSHLYHYRCLHPLLIQNFPGFSCPLCRTYSDLDANVAVEKEQVKEILGLDRKDTITVKKQQKSKAAATTSTDLDQSVPNTSLLTAVSASSSSSSSSSSPPLPPPIPLSPTHNTIPALDDMMVTSDTEMRSSAAATSNNNNNNNHASSSSGSGTEEDEEEEEHHHHHHARAHPTTITGRRKSTGPDGTGFLATTLVGSPSPFELMMPSTPTPMDTDSPPHQHPSYLA